MCPVEAKRWLYSQKYGTVRWDMAHHLGKLETCGPSSLSILSAREGQPDILGQQRAIRRREGASAILRVARTDRGYRVKFLAARATSALSRCGGQRIFPRRGTENAENASPEAKSCKTGAFRPKALCVLCASAWNACRPASFRSSVVPSRPTPRASMDQTR